MNTKLTLTLEKKVIERMKVYAREKGHSLSELVENYFKFLMREHPPEPSKPYSGKLTSLQGILKVDKGFDYKKILEEEIIRKHGA